MFCVHRDSTDVEVLNLIRHRCRTYGEVVHLLLMPGLPDRRFAIVEMSTIAQTHKLAASLGQTAFDDRTVVIRLRYSLRSVVSGSKVRRPRPRSSLQWLERHSQDLYWRHHGALTAHTASLCMLKISHWTLSKYATSRRGATSEPGRTYWPWKSFAHRYLSLQRLRITLRTAHWSVV